MRGQKSPSPVKINLDQILHSYIAIDEGISVEGLSLTKDFRQRIRAGTQSLTACLGRNFPF